MVVGLHRRPSPLLASGPYHPVRDAHGAERTRAGFGAVKLTGTPLRRCAFEVERAYAGTSSEGSRCSNRRFFDAPDAGSEAIRCFDLREGLSSA
ncbi:MAG: hypothetical protein H0V26_11005 [Solirubrobacterales bacterium]|nr:hypothetical protein [Solirubrobacterales bacterium]